MDNRPPDSNRNEQPNNEGGSPLQNPNNQRIWLIVGGAVILLFLWMLMNNSGGLQGTPTTFNEVAEDIRRGNVARVTVYGGTDIIIEYSDGRPNGAAYKNAETDLFERIGNYGITDMTTFQYAERPGNDSSSVMLQIAIAIVPTLLIVWLLWRMMRSVRFGQDQAMSFGRSRPRVMRDMERPQVTFADVAGAEEAKEELKEIVEFLKEPEKFIRLGARVPKGVLMVGPPGTGKTLMARAVAGEAGVPFFSISGSEFVEMFVGVGASRVRDLFDRSKAEAPAIIFVDEIDAVGRHRGAGLGGGHDEREQTLNQILVEMDGFDTDTNVIIIAATNRPDILDPALLRPGRFDRKVTMDNPDIKGRLDILKVHAKGKPLSADVDLEAIAKITVGFSGADLENLINEAAILAARRNKKSISMSEMQESMERVSMGPERRSRVMTPKTKSTTAYHEAGHAVVHYFLEHASAVHKITIIPRGQAGGYTMPLPEEENYYPSREQFEDMIASLMGGRAAEEIVLNQFTTGASNDLQRSTRLAHQMVTQFGMSEKLGPRTFGTGQHQVFLGREIAEQRDYSDHYAEEIDNEVKRILTTGYQRAKNILVEHREKLDSVARALLDYETIDGELFNQIMDGSHNPLANGRTNPA